MKNSRIYNKIRTVENWPKPGVQFRDITTLLQHPRLVEQVVDQFVTFAIRNKCNSIVAMDARGFLFATPVSLRTGLPVSLARKKGKLPAETVSATYQLEYGEDTVEIHKNSIKKNSNVLLIDDLVATGGTVLAVNECIKRLDAELVAVAVVIDLPDIGGSNKIKNEGIKFYKCVSFEGE